MEADHLDINLDAPVFQSPTVIFSITPNIITNENIVIMAWDVSYASSVTINGFNVPLQGQANLTFEVREDTTFELIATGPGGTVNRVILVNFTNTSPIRHILPDYFKIPYVPYNDPKINDMRYIGTAFDLIPNFAKNYTHRPIRHGFWDDVNIWDVKDIPDEFSKVYIPYSTSITVRNGSWFCDSCTVFGYLNFDVNSDIKFNICNFLIAPEGAFVDGTKDNPVPPNKKHEIIFMDKQLNLGKIGDSYGVGLIYDIKKKQQWNPLSIETGGSTSLFIKGK